MLALILVFILSACGSANNASSPPASQSSPAASQATAPASLQSPEAAEPSEAADRAVTDAMGHEVTIPADPQRIIASYLEDHLVTLGVTPVAQWSVTNGIQDYLQPAGLEGVPTIDYNLPPEAVASFSPDLILIGSETSVQNGLYEQYAKIAPTYVLGDQVINDWRSTLLKIGELLGKSDDAKQAIADYDAKAADTKAKLQSVIGDKPVAIVWLVQKQFFVVNKEVSSGAVLFGDLGLKQSNLTSSLPDATANWNPITLEKLAELDADYLLLVNSDGEGAEVLKDPIWKNIPAIKAGQVYEFSRSSSWLYNGAAAGERMMDDLLQALNIG